ncbi:MAG: ATP-grasp domain-containing protein [Gammaproteobacteria bacterium]
MITIQEKAPVIIVDAYSMAREIVRGLRERRINCFHIRSSEHRPADARSFEASLFQADLGYLGEPTACASALALLSPAAVVAGSDGGMGYANKIGRALGLATDATAASDVGIDKFAMNEAVRCAGLNVPEQTLASNASEARAWAEQRNRWPVVIKPNAGSGAAGVRICYKPQQIDAAFAEHSGSQRESGHNEPLLLLQSFASGRQYVVNTVSHAGKHYVTDAWRRTFCSIATTAVVPKELHLLDPKSAPATALFENTRRALDVLGIRNGPARTELKWIRNGVTFLETSPQLMNVPAHRGAHREAGLPVQSVVLAASLASSRAEWDRNFGTRKYKLRKLMAKLFFSFDAPGVVQSVRGLARLRSLPSFQAHDGALAPGDKVWRTSDTRAHGGVVHLVHPEAEQIERDIQTIREWESGGELYDVATEDSPEMLIPRVLLMKAPTVGDTR